MTMMKLELELLLKLFEVVFLAAQFPEGDGYDDDDAGEVGTRVVAQTFLKCCF